jgi:cell division protein ZapA
MAQVSIDINDRHYTVGCEDGQEKHLAALSKVFDRHVRSLSTEIGRLGETRLFLMAALLLADELHEVQERLAERESALAAARADQSAVEVRAVAALEHAARKIEAIAAD